MLLPFLSSVSNVRSYERSAAPRYRSPLRNRSKASALRRMHARTGSTSGSSDGGGKTPGFTLGAGSAAPDNLSLTANAYTHCKCDTLVLCCVFCFESAAQASPPRSSEALSPLAVDAKSVT